MMMMMMSISISLRLAQWAVGDLPGGEMYSHQPHAPFIEAF